MSSGGTRCMWHGTFARCGPGTIRRANHAAATASRGIRQNCLTAKQKTTECQSARRHLRKALHVGLAYHALVKGPAVPLGVATGMWQDSCGKHTHWSKTNKGVARLREQSRIMQSGKLHLHIAQHFITGKEVAASHSDDGAHGSHSICNSRGRGGRSGPGLYASRTRSAKGWRGLIGPKLSVSA